MKTVLCYGDSNTWGWDPASRRRLARDVRWTGVLRNELGNAYEIIEEGLCGRTTVWDDMLEEGKNGRNYLTPCLASHRPVDLVVLMLGTNDLKNRFSASALDIASGVGVLAADIQKSAAGPGGSAPETLILCPPPVERMTEFAEMFIGAEIKSGELAKNYRQVAKNLGCHYIDTSRFIKSSKVDGIHLDAQEHLKLGQVVAERIKNRWRC